MNLMNGKPTVTNPQKDKENEWGKLIVALLFILLSFICVFCSSQLAILIIDRTQVPGGIKARRQADYSPGLSIALAPLDRDRIIAEIIKDEQALLTGSQFQAAGAIVVAVLPQAPLPAQLLPTLTPTSTLPPPTAIPAATLTPQPTSTPTAESPPTSQPPTAIPSPTPLPPPTVSLPTPTVPLPTGTVPVPSPTLPLPSATSPPPTLTPPPPATSTPNPADTATSTPLPSNQLPDAGNDTATVAEDLLVVINVLANDSDADGTLDTNTLTIIGGPANGTAIIDALTKQITYDPNDNFNGSDSLTYRICDNSGGCDTATVTINVTPVNDAPIAVNDSLLADEDVLTTLSVTLNDIDVDNNPLFVSAVGVAGGTVIINGSNLSYTSAPNFSGVDVFTYTVSDGSLTDTATVTVTVRPVNNPPNAIDDETFTAEDTSENIAVLANDADIDSVVLTIIAVGTPANGQAIIAGNSVTYIPNDNFDGEDSFSYTISDGFLTDLAMITVTIIPINDPPVALPDSYNTPLNTTLNVSAPGVLANDTDVENNPLTALQVTGPASGSLTLQSNGAFTYVPNTGFSGADSFTYRANDGAANSNITVVTLNVN